jgi:hypothetical protein
MVYRTKQIMEEIRDEITNAIHNPPFYSPPEIGRLDQKLTDKILKEKGYYEIFQELKKHLDSKQRKN